MSAGVRGFGPGISALMVGAVLVLAVAACGGTSTATTSTTTSTTTATTAASQPNATSALPTTLPTTATTTPGTCSAWGKAFGVSFNKGAAKQGNPERMLDVCCAPKNKAGVSHCELTLTLKGTTSRGCELIDLNPAGMPVSVGRRIRCTPLA